MAWAYLTVAGLFEIGWAIGLKYSDGFSKPFPSLLTITAMVLSLVAGAPDRIRTCDPQIRNLVLYPTELRALARRRILAKNVMETHCLFLFV